MALPEEHQSSFGHPIWILFYHNTPDFRIYIIYNTEIRMKETFKVQHLERYPIDFFQPQIFDILIMFHNRPIFLQR